MSGGSFDYLCVAEPEQLAFREDDLVRMHSRLIDFGAIGAADRTLAIIAAIRHVRSLANGMYEPWHAIEWRDSGDWGDDQVKRSLADWEVKHRQPVVPSTPRVVIPSHEDTGGGWRVAARWLAKRRSRA